MGDGKIVIQPGKLTYLALYVEGKGDTTEIKSAAKRILDNVEHGYENALLTWGGDASKVADAKKYLKEQLSALRKKPDGEIKEKRAPKAKASDKPVETEVKTAETEIKFEQAKPRKKGSAAKLSDKPIQEYGNDDKKKIDNEIEETMRKLDNDFYGIRIPDRWKRICSPYR